MIPSHRQQVVYDEWQLTDNNILIQAVAGGAKTTTLIGLLERSEYRTLILAFNKSIQEEFEKKIQEGGYQNGKAMTLHSLGLKAIQNHYGRVTVNKNKNYDLIRKLGDYNRRLFGSMPWEEKIKTTITLQEMNDVSRIYLTDNKVEIFQYMNVMDKYYYEHPNLDDLWTDFLYIREASYTDTIIIDFLDMIFLAVKENLLIPIQPYYLMVDEAQDLNLAQHAMIDMLIAQGDVHKWVAVGDIHQSIYGFSGAHGNSFELFRQKGNVIELPLDVCYRCPQLVIEEANDIFNVMIGFKEEPGLVETIENPEEIQEGSMVVCRNTNPLIELYFKLLGLGYKVYLKGEDILGSLTRHLKPYNYKTVVQAGRMMKEEITELASKENKTDEDRIKLWRMNQNYSNFILLYTHFARPSDKVEILLQCLANMFEEANDSNSVMLCTIHKAKGLEADRVYILNEFLIPSKFAKSPQQILQEKNLKYVARTRSKQELYYLNIGKPQEEYEEL